jgi:hypothetical protein
MVPGLSLARARLLGDGSPIKMEADVRMIHLANDANLTSLQRILIAPLWWTTPRWHLMDDMHLLLCIVVKSYMEEKPALNGFQSPVLVTVLLRRRNVRAKDSVIDIGKSAALRAQRRSRNHCI